MNLTIIIFGIVNVPKFAHEKKGRLEMEMKRYFEVVIYSDSGDYLRFKYDDLEEAYECYKLYEGDSYNRKLIDVTCVVEERNWYYA